MPKSFQIQIPTPCHESWESMSRTQKGRFCQSCQKTVIDFSTMSDAQIIAWFSTSEGNSCGRFASTQLERDFLNHNKLQLTLLKRLVLLLPGFMITAGLKGQNTKADSIEVVQIMNATLNKAQSQDTVNRVMLDEVTIVACLDRAIKSEVMGGLAIVTRKLNHWQLITRTIKNWFK